MAPAQILCTRCAAVAAEPRAECAKCGGRTARICGACGHQNSIAKNFCDKCGQPISALGPISPPPRAQSPGAAADDLPATAVRRLLPAGSVPAVNAPLDDLWAAPKAPPPAAPPPPPPPAGRRRMAALSALALAALASAFGWTWRQNRRPEIIVPRLAARYLDSLRTGDFPGAYALLTDAAQKNCSETDFQSAGAEPGWTWSDLRIERQEPEAVLLSYSLAAKGAAARRERALFVLDGKRWALPFDRTLLSQAGEAFKKGDPAKARALAQEAAAVNPRDPAAWASLCEAAYAENSSDDAEMRCSKALELANESPSALDSKSLYRLHALLADTYGRRLSRPARAAEHYSAMLNFPDLPASERCQILLARAQSYAATSRFGASIADLEQAAPLCADPRDQAFIRKLREDMHAPDNP